MYSNAPGPEGEKIGLDIVGLFKSIWGDQTYVYPILGVVITEKPTSSIKQDDDELESTE